MTRPPSAFSTRVKSNMQVAVVRVISSTVTPPHDRSRSALSWNASITWKIGVLSNRRLGRNACTTWSNGSSWCA